MGNKTSNSRGDQTPVTGGLTLPSNLVSAPSMDDDVPDDDLGMQAYWLLKLHPDAVSLKFRKSDLAAMDDETKRSLIADIQFALGVAPIKGDVL